MFDCSRSEWVIKGVVIMIDSDCYKWQGFYRRLWFALCWEISFFGFFQFKNNELRKYKKNIASYKNMMRKYCENLKNK